jgi:voltage-dependent calcium channel T type alpha-1I
VTLKMLNNLFTCVFFMEMVLKMAGLGLANYMKDHYNLFDSIVVLMSIIDFVIE